MSATLNKVQIIGRLGKDPQFYTMGNGHEFSRISVATGDKWIDKKTGKEKSSVEWHSIMLYGPRNQTAKYLAKSMAVYVEGFIKSSKYKNKEGIEKTKYEIIAMDIKILGGKKPVAEYQDQEKEVELEQHNLDDDIPF